MDSSDLYYIIDRDAYILTVPGKFTLFFRLAVNMCRHFGIEPVESVKLKNEEVGHFIEQPMHCGLAGQLAMRAGTGGESLPPGFRGWR